ncbi:MAG: 6-phosphofructokinase [Candidatus Omnitrophica bacterium]|nr:6-phosphofructokinase [Candidatus Omnitrophota bacterium]
MKKIGIVTSGGDAPGMNAAIRSVVRTAIYNNIEICGIYDGFKGLYEKNFSYLNSRSVSGIINQGGTILKTKRFYEFKEREIREICYKNLREEQIEALVVIGGDGSAKGAYLLYKEFNFPTVHIPASIDNDVYGTDYTVGFDTAVNTAISAIDRIRDTATSHERIFIVEVMGRECGNLAFEVGIVCGAEIVLIPEVPFNIDDVVKEIKEEEKKGKKSCIIVIAEGAIKAEELTEILKEKLPEREIRYTVLGYIQRGGSPTYLTRKLATIFGVKAVELLIERQYGYMVGIKGEEIVFVPLSEVVSKKKIPKIEYMDIVKKMAI